MLVKRKILTLLTQLFFIEEDLILESIEKL
nr:MAG TPA: hypothetical protein [Caudoviricetes sp.]